MRKAYNQQSVDQIVDTIMDFQEGTKLLILAPVIRGRKGTHEKILEKIKKRDSAASRLTER